MHNGLITTIGNCGSVLLDLWTLRGTCPSYTPPPRPAGLQAAETGETLGQRLAAAVGKASGHGLGGQEKEVGLLMSVIRWKK